MRMFSRQTGQQNSSPSWSPKGSSLGALSLPSFEHSPCLPDPTQGPSSILRHTVLGSAHYTSMSYLQSFLALSLARRKQTEPSLAPWEYSTRAYALSWVQESRQCLRP